MCAKGKVYFEGKAMVACDGKTEEYSIDFKVGKYDSDPFDDTDNWEKGNAIEAFLRKYLPKGTVICQADCTGGNEECLARTIKATVPKGSGKFKKAKVDGDDYIYYLKITDNCTVKFTVKCKCCPFPD